MLRAGKQERSATMWVTSDQAVEIYARFLKSRYGNRAKKVTEEKAAQLRSAGDVEGERVWSEVRREIDRQQATSPSFN
jgi:hypothetical protein